VVLYPDQSGIGEFKFSAAQAGAAARLYVACGTSYEKTVEALLYGHQFWTEKAVEGDFLPSESTLSNWVTAIGQVEWERTAEVTGLLYRAESRCADVLCASPLQSIAIDLTHNKGSMNTDASGGPLTFIGVCLCSDAV